MLELCCDGSSFERNVRLEMGRKLLGSSESRPGFLRRGVTAASFRGGGTLPEFRELMVSVKSENGLMDSSSESETGRWSQRERGRPMFSERGGQANSLRKRETGRRSHPE